MSEEARLPGRYVLGLDLGQVSDFSALAVARRVPAFAPVAGYDLLALKRWPLGTPYPAIVADVKNILSRPPFNCPPPVFALDYTGAGRPVWDMFRAARVDAAGICITGGDAVTHPEPTEWHVPKRDLVSIVQVLLQEKRLQWPEKLPLASLLAAELANFRTKITLAANDTYGTRREGQHDDCVLAVALACWAGEHIEAPGRLAGLFFPGAVVSGWGYGDRAGAGRRS